MSWPRRFRDDGVDPESWRTVAEWFGGDRGWTTSSGIGLSLAVDPDMIRESCTSVFLFGAISLTNCTLVHPVEGYSSGTKGQATGVGGAPVGSGGVTGGGVAAGGAGTNEGGTVGDAIAGAAGFLGDAGATDSAPEAEPPPGSFAVGIPACEECAMTWCSSEAMACVQHPACAARAQCFASACPDDVTLCAAACKMYHGGAAAETLSVCLAIHCSLACFPIL